jgi:hypothetical protein
VIVPTHVKAHHGIARLKVSVSDQHTKPNLHVRISTTAGRLQVGKFKGVTITGNNTRKVNLFGKPAAINHVLAGLSLSLGGVKKATVTVTAIDGTDTNSATISVS